MNICEYGCGQEAKHQFKNGKWCCKDHWMKCSNQQKKISTHMENAWKNLNSKLNLISKETRIKNMKDAWKDPNSEFNSISFRKKISDTVKNIWDNPDSIYNSASFRKDRSNIMKKARKDPNSKFNTDLYIENLSKRMKEGWDDPNSGHNSISRKEKLSNSIKEVHKNPDSIFNSTSFREKRKLNIKKINKKYLFFSKIEEIRYNPDKPIEEKEIQVHCKNHECKNSKEKGGWFTPTKSQLGERLQALENPRGFGESNFYCSQHCKDTCPLYGLQGDPFKNTELPYTSAEKHIWRQVVLELDKGLCQFCGKPATDVHHIKPVKTHPHLALDPDNGISFCEECHYKIGHQGECSTGNLAKIIQSGCVLGGQ